MVTQLISLQTPDCPKTVEYTAGRVLTPILEEHCTEQGHIQTGYLLKLIDFAGTMPVFRLVNGENDFVTASLDRTHFMDRIYAWEYALIESRVTKVFRSSVEVQVKVSALDHRDPTVKPRPIATAYLVYVAKANDGHKIILPALPIHSEREYHRFAQAEIRRKNRLTEAAETTFYPIQSDDQPYVIELSQHLTKRETNAQGNVFGGVILKLVGQVSRQAAQQHALGATVLGASIDRMNFIAPTFAGEMVLAKAMLTRTWTTSMEVQVEIYAENPNYPGDWRLIANSSVVLVRINDHTGEPAPVPEWRPQTETQKNRAQQADIRRAIRLKEKLEAKQVKKESLPWSLKLNLMVRRFLEKVSLAWTLLGKADE